MCEDMKESLNDKAKGSATKTKSNSSAIKTDKLETKKVDSSKKTNKKYWQK